MTPQRARPLWIEDKGVWTMQTVPVFLRGWKVILAQSKMYLFIQVLKLQMEKWTRIVQWRSW